MPTIKSALKRMKQTAKRRERNTGIKRNIKSAVKAFRTKPTAKTLSAAQSEYDTAVKKGLLKKTTAARRKSGLAKTAKAAGVKLEKTAAKPAAKKPAAKKTTVAKKPAAKKTTVAKKPAAKKAATAKKPAAKKTAKQ